SPCSRCDPALREPVRLFRPVAKRFGMNADRVVVADHRPRFAQIEPIAQIACGSLALAYFVRVRGCEQPLRERALAHACPGRAEQLEQAALAEQIEVGCVDVVGVFEACAESAFAGPSILDACDPATIERNGSPGAR